MSANASAVTMTIKALKILDKPVGELAQMVERSLSMWEVGGSIPPFSKTFFFYFDNNQKTLSYYAIFCKLKSSLTNKKVGCIVRESNPGRPRGRRAFYHWTNDADTRGVDKVIGEIQECSKNCGKFFAVGRIRTCAPRGNLISSQTP